MRYLAAIMALTGFSAVYEVSVNHGSPALLNPIATATGIGLVACLVIWAVYLRRHIERRVTARRRVLKMIEEA